MQREKFESFYTDVLSKHIEELMEIDKKSGLNCLKRVSGTERKIYNNYENKRKQIRRFFMNLECKPMDRHKIGAVMMYAVLKASPIRVDKSIPNIPDELLMANEYLAFYAALSIIDSYRRDEFGIDTVECDLILPATSTDAKDDDAGATYINNTCKALYYIDDAENFDIFAYANILFLLEKYTNIKKSNL